jgi:hypothetical protein
LRPHRIQQPIAEIGDELRERDDFLRFGGVGSSARIGFYTVKHWFSP